MRTRGTAIIAAAWLLAVPLSITHAEDNTLQYQYLRIYLKINNADQLEKQGNYSAALSAFKECYTALQKIHNSDPNWESALVIQRMNDCRSKIVDLSNRPLANNPPTPTVTSGEPPPVPSPVASQSPDVQSLQQKLVQVQQELSDTRAKLQNSQIEVVTLKSQLEAVNQQLHSLKGATQGENQIGRLLTQNQQLQDKLAAAQKEISSFKSSPKSALALMRTQLKNTQDKLDASEAANSALQATTTTLRQQLDDAQADLRAANQRLASASPTSSDYATLKHENEVMREILTRELQEQAHRDMAKRLAQEEFDRLRITSKVLQEQLDILGSPMTPPTSDQERALLDSLKVATQVAPVPSETASNGFAATNAAPMSPSAPETATNAPSETASATNTPSTNAPSEVAASTNTPPAAPPLTNQPLANADKSVPAIPPTSPTTVTPAGTPPTTNVAETATNAASANTNSVAATPPDTNAPSASTNAAPASTNTAAAQPPETNAPAATTNAAPGTAANTSTNAAPAGTNAADEFSAKPRLPDDMRDTAQQAADLFKMQRYDDAAAKYQEIIEKYPESLYAWSNLGVVRFQQGKLNEALKALQQAVKLSPSDAFSYSNLGIVYYQMNQYEQAISALERALALDPSNAKSHNYLGCACSQKGWSEVAEREFLKAIELDDNFGDAHFNLALVYATEKPPSLEMARRHYKRALELGIAPDARLEKLLQMDGGTQNPPASEQK